DSRQQQPIQGWYCTCTVGSRVIGCCNHIAALLWHLGINQASTDLPQHPQSSDHYVNYIDNSLVYEDFDSDENTDIRYSLADDSDNDSDN
ncbi:unnamed protein product, partial [Didymodactylos carnosus]